AKFPSKVPLKKVEIVLMYLFIYFSPKAIFECEVSEPNIQVMWMKDGQELEISERYLLLSTERFLHRLMIQTVRMSDAGEYSVVAGSSVSKASLTVEAKLDNLFFIEEPKSIHITESKFLYSKFLHSKLYWLWFNVFISFFTFSEGTATFIAKVGGDPIPSVKWMKGKWRQLTHGGRIVVEQKGQEAKLEIREVTKSDAGQYRCVASNKYGEIECSTDLNVDEKKELGLEAVTLKKTPSKQKSPKEDKEIDIVELLRNVDPKEYEKYARMYGITDYRGLLQAIEQLKREKEEETITSNAF
uniref:Ig-like domain-containing protein n=1 Tax=Denticeps clupeoides TaxID=299321 RepID=A0AAY4EWE6_9TELE